MLKYINIDNKIKKLTDEEIKKLETKKDYKQLRKMEYGTLSQQIEFITENGVEAWQQKVRDIKVKHPKPKTLTAI
ncbi:MAG: hypothetical protein OIF36_00350 [Alphaproteobacteria bacterium]|nr:hypothetical protein [Alphaproteobacteria bacterium]